MTVDQENILSKFINDTDLGWVADTPDGYAVIQMDLNKIENWMDRNLGQKIITNALQDMSTHVVAIISVEL